MPNKMTIHTLKIEKKYYGEILAGRKTFEWRKDDRDFKVGDFIFFKLLTGIAADGTPLYQTSKLSFEITYILRDAENLGLPKGYCVLAIHPKMIGAMCYE